MLAAQADAPPPQVQSQAERDGRRRELADDNRQRADERSEPFDNAPTGVLIQSYGQQRRQSADAAQADAHATASHRRATKHLGAQRGGQNQRQDACRREQRPRTRGVRPQPQHQCPWSHPAQIHRRQPDGQGEAVHRVSSMRIA